MITEKIKDIEAEMARTQRNKATSNHLGILKAKLAKLRREILTPSTTGGGGPGVGFDVIFIIKGSKNRSCSCWICRISLW